jgi:class 3 adenylate cyclase/tetratricopeptide (TPR) repeat protein
VTQNDDPFGWVGAIIDGKFKVEQFVAEGGFGAVYRGFHVTLQVSIAIKCILSPRGLDDARQKKLISDLLAEANTLDMLSRKTVGVVQVYDIGAAISPKGRWTPYIVMEWLEGKTLKAEMEVRRRSGRGPMGIAEACRLLKPAADALVIAHRNNVSHRDIKPANLFLTQSRDGVRMKVLDFGIAKIMSEVPSIERTSTTSPFTPFYGAPEQFQKKHGATGPWTDVFAMALTILEVASGRCVLQGPSVMDLYESAMHAHRRAVLLKHVAPENLAVVDVLQRALAPEPARRYRALGELWSDLEYAIGEDWDEAEPTPLPESLPALGEHRVCTVMLVRLSNMDALRACLEPEEVKEVVDRLLAAVTDQAKRLGGVVEPTGLDRALVAFGVMRIAPRMADNHAERAVLAALRGRAALSRVAPPRASRPVSLSAEIAINTGRVFVRWVLERKRQVLTVTGEGERVAEHLLQTAPPGAIVIGRETYRQTAGRFNLEPLPSIPVHVQDRSELLPRYRVKSAIALRAPFDSTDFRGIETKLVGRTAERQQIIDALETMLSERRAQLVTLVGLPGVGMSRMLQDFFSHLTARKELVLVLAGRCSPLFADTSYSLFSALLRQRFSLDDRDLPLHIQRKLRIGLRFFRARWLNGKWPADEGLAWPSRLEKPSEPELLALDAAVTQTAGFIGRAATEVMRDPASLDDSGTQMKQQNTAAVLLLARFVTRRMPLVILCDDLQWADDASLDFLEALVQRGENLPVLLVCSAQPELVERRPDWGKSAEAQHLTRLGSLPRRHMEEIIKDWLRQIPDLSEELIHMLADRAEGNLLILKETLDYLVDAGEIEVREEGTWGFRARPGALRLPPTIQGIVQSRLDRLEPEAREMLEQAAVVGRSFLHGAVDHLRRAASGGQRGRPTEVILQQLRDRGWISLSPLPTIPGERESMFVESATWEVAYETQGARVRRPQHLLVANWLEQRASHPAVAALFARHYDQGGDAKRAAAAHLRAAAHATSLGDTAAALRHLERARTIHDEARGKQAREGGEDRRIATFPDRVRLRLDLGDALRRAGRLDDAERSYGEARGLLLWAERRAGVGPEPNEALRWDAYIDARLALLHKLRGSLPEARVLIERAIDRMIEAGAIKETPAMYALLASLLYRERRLDESWQAARKGLRNCWKFTKGEERRREDVAEILLGVGAALYGRGRMISAERTFRQVERVVFEVDHPHLLGMALNGVAGARLARGDARGAREAMLQALFFKERAGDLSRCAVGYSNLAEIELRLQETPTALEHAREAVRLGEQARAGSDLADIYRNLAEAELGSGALGAAIDAGEKALGIAEKRGRVYIGDVAVTLARVLSRATEASMADAPLGEKVKVAAAALGVALLKHFKGDDLRGKAEECRALLSRASIKI